MSDPEFEPTRIDVPTVPADDGDPTQAYSVVGGGPPGGELPPRPPGPPAPDRRPWIIIGLLAAIVLVLLLVLFLNSDGDDDDVDATSTTTSEAVTSTSESTTSTSAATTTSAAPTTTDAPIVTVPPEECAEAGNNPNQPGMVADTVFDAWVRGDKACAAELMTPAALDELFDRDGAGATDEFQGCTEVDQPDPHADCAFTYEGGSTHYLMNFSATEGWKVFDVEQTAD
jgi:cytoskeletal protein RodZ